MNLGEVAGGVRLFWAESVACTVNVWGTGESPATTAENFVAATVAVAPPDELTL